MFADNLIARLKRHIFIIVFALRSDLAAAAAAVGPRTHCGRTRRPGASLNATHRLGRPSERQRNVGARCESAFRGHCLGGSR